MEFYNDKKTVTANEINKFCYCPYQWYYERLYGTKELRRLANERNEALGLTDRTQSNFEQGLEYHSRAKFRGGAGRIIIAFLLILLAVFCFLKVRGIV